VGVLDVNYYLIALIASPRVFYCAKVLRKVEGGDIEGF